MHRFPVAANSPLAGAHQANAGLLGYGAGFGTLADGRAARVQLDGWGPPGWTSRATRRPPALRLQDLVVAAGTRLTDVDRRRLDRPPDAPGGERVAARHGEVDRDLRGCRRVDRGGVGERQAAGGARPED